jgi:tRNA threonylcarbamoyladenosine biosynthesis protein TsaB
MSQQTQTPGFANNTRSLSVPVASSVKLTRETEAMRLALAVDTTAEYGSIALADEAGVREEVALHSLQGFSHMLFAEIEALLVRQRVTLRDIDVFAGASGPGSFTGVRVGLAAMKGLAEVLGTRVVAVSNLAAIAESGKSNLRAVVIDARRGEIYGAVYDSEGNQILPESVLPLQRFLSQLPEGPLEWITQGLAGAAPERCRVIEAPREIAGAIARIALRSHALDPAAIEANYVRRSDAELLWKEI